MKKISLIFILNIFLLVLFACNNNTVLTRLDTPKNIIVDKNHITFDKVQYAEKYIINLNGVNHTINTNEFTINEEGEFTVRIKASAEGYLDSLLTEDIFVTVKFLNYPDNIRIENNRIVYDLVTGADSYNIKINDTIYNTAKDIIPYLEEGEYKIQIQSVSKTFVDSKYSPILSIVISGDEYLHTKHQYRYSFKSEFDLPLYHYLKSVNNLVYELYLVKDNEELQIDKSNIYVKDQIVYLKNDYIKSLDKNTQNFVLRTNLGEHEIELIINERELPYVYSDLRVQNDYYHDVIFRIENFGYELKEIKVSDQTIEKYTYQNNILLIKQEYIKEYFTKNESKTELVLNLILKHENGNSIVIILVIKR